ncbi:hypothetical protein HYFRA_00002837 [Hymenoscyphus fraxineus]|uniref:Zn(2)-C6 fungal-type domain-containing protein n=1 Tax=Hymenoscyphus fraxineus TaxID=746836 RepID=A0A9N9KPB6_9HELO|nr:hypothetical protein HYFRA_00002837 [Hymenoscyphus fraxineus]
MLVVYQSNSMSTRKRVSQACKLCAIKKVKCDGALPKCGPCVIRSEECEYGISKRRRQFYTPPSNSATSPNPQSRMLNNLSLPPTGPSFSHFTSPNGAPLPHLAHRPLSPTFNISADISKRLFQVYFATIHPMWPLLYKPLYTSLDYTYPSPGIPESLVLAIFSIASCADRADNQGPDLERSPDNYPEPQVFFEEALNLLQQAPGEDRSRRLLNAFVPSISTCQVLAILALQQHGVAEYTRAALLCNLACGMAIELQLHRVYEPNEPVEREIRSRLWWNLYILEKMISGEQGRPIILRVEESDCPWPSTSESDEFELMPIQASPNQTNGLSRSNHSVKMQTMSALHTTISLSIILERVYREIYGLAARKNIREDQVAGERTRLLLLQQLRKWESDFEGSPLRLDLEEMTSVPAAITNIVIMLTGVIMCNRPFILSWRPGTSDVLFNGHEESPFDICLQAAQNMCSILEKYLERLSWWPCDMVFSIFVAATVLLHHSKQANGEVAVETKGRLKLCIHWLSVLGKSWKTAGARQQLLADLFDLPQSLQQNASNDVPMQQSTNAMQGISQQQPAGHLTLIPPPSNELDPPGTKATGVSSQANWSFLKEFGDSTDQFYSWDVELRNLLDAEHKLDAFAFT